MRIQNFIDVELEQCCEAFVEPKKLKKSRAVDFKRFSSSLPGFIPPFASDTVTEELMCQFMSYDANSSVFEGM